jgi:predicted phage baseplate assembly protein
MEEDRRARLRFGDDRLGRHPPVGTCFRATYRLGNGQSGNVGAETITRLVLVAPRPSEGGGDLRQARPRNPLPAVGGTEPEPLAEAKELAPGAFRRELARAITADDYARLAERHPAVQRAAASLRWSGAWYEAVVAIDALGGVADPALLEAVRRSLRPYRRLGHELAVVPAVYVPLDLALRVYVRPEYLRGHLKVDLLARLGSGSRAGLFHPDNLSFGGGVAASRVIAAAQAVTGVERVELIRLQRFGEAARGELDAGFLPLAPDEIARLDNDPNMPENGRLELTMVGGR